MNLLKHLSILVLFITKYVFSFQNYLHVNYHLKFSQLILLHIIEKSETQKS